MPSARLLRLLAGTKLRRGRVMCFGGGGGGAPDYKEPDYGPLPSLRADETVKDQDPVYADYRPRGAARRSFFTMGNT